MSRYADIDALMQSIRSRLGIATLDNLLESEKAIVKEIDSAPSIDITPRKAVKGYEGYYEVDMYGRVYSLERTITVNDNGRVYEKPIKECKLSQSTHSAGYKTVGLTRDGKTETAYVHRLVAEAYIPNPQDLPFINHKDEDKANNFVTNLEWCTEQYNSTYGTAREKQAEAIRGRKQSEEHKQKRSEAMKKYWAEKKEADDFCSYGVHNSSEKPNSSERSRE